MFLENIKNSMLLTLLEEEWVNNLDLVFTNEEGMLDDVIHESPLGKSDHSVLVFYYVCYAQLADHDKLRFFYNNGNYIMSHRNCDNVLGSGDIN